MKIIINRSVCFAPLKIEFVVKQYSILSFMDPFDQKVIDLLSKKREEAKQLVVHQKESYPVEEESVQDRLPFEISKTVQYIQQEEYLRKRKALKKQGDIL